MIGEWGWIVGDALIAVMLAALPVLAFVTRRRG